MEFSQSFQVPKILLMTLVYSMVYGYRFWTAMQEKKASESGSRIEPEEKNEKLGFRMKVADDLKETKQELETKRNNLISDRS